jgi:adenine-specific DNA-methyltransferase
MLKAEGRMGWILPETLLHASYGRQILNWSTQNFSRCVAVSLRERCFKTEGTKERVVVLLLSGSGSKATRGVEMIEFSSAQDCVNAIPKLASNTSKILPQLNGHAVPHLVSNFASNAAQALEEAEEFKRFGDFADVKIGVVTGDNDYFVLSELQRAKEKVRKAHFQRVVCKFVDAGSGFVMPKGGHADTTDETRNWLLCPSPKSQDEKLKRYLKKYSRDAITKNRTMAKRSHWHVPLLGQTPDAFFRYMGKIGPRMVLNRAGWRCTNSVHAVYFKEGTSAAAKRAICLSLHSSYSQLYAEFEGRQYGSGVLKFEPGESKRLLLAHNPRLVKVLSTLWTEFDLRRHDTDWEDIVPHIDEAIVKNCPNLAKKLPLSQVYKLLATVRRRRSSIYVATTGV